jgi:transposase
MPFAGLDVHKRVVEAVVLDDDGNIVHRARFDCTRDALERFATKVLSREHRVALEATTNTWAVVGLLEPHVAEVVVSNPMRTRAIAEAKVKTDKVDALVLAQLLRCDYLPRVWQPDSDTRQRRSLCTRRASLVQQRTAIKNRIHALFHQRLMHPPVGELFGSKGLAWLREVELDDTGRAMLDSDLRLLDGIERELDRAHVELCRVGHADPNVKLLMTLPGFDVTVAQAVVATLGDVRRFPNADDAAAYIGLVPSTYQSANHCYHGPITKQGRSHTRWLLVQAAQHIHRHPGPLGVFFRRLAKKKNRNVAVVATARKLVVIAWHMLKNNEPYRYAIPRTTEQKLARLRVKATGERRRGGTTKGAPRHPHYGTGKATRTVPAIDQVYDREQLPAPTPLTDGERRMLEQTGTARFAEQIRRPNVVPRNGSGPRND